MAYNITGKVRERLFLIHEQSRLLTMIADMETMVLEKNERLGKIIESLEETVELCRIEECYLTDYEMLLEQKYSLDEELKRDREYMNELIVEYNAIEEELIGGKN